MPAKIPDYRTQTLQGNGDASAQDIANIPLALTLLHYKNSELEGMVTALTEPACFGRSGSPEVNVGLDADPHVSRVHARVRLHERGAVVEDLGSRNGTFVNGARVAHAELRPGDILRIGGTLFELARPERAGRVEPDATLIGRSPSFTRTLHEIMTYAPAPVSVLITGESGSGKELFAERLHTASKRSGPLVAVNCAAISETLFEATLFGHRKGAFTGATQDNEGLYARADGGTLLLDEVGELPRAFQAKLLRVLETGEFFAVGNSAPQSAQVRVVSATNANLAAKLQHDEFRQDLYARLAATVVHVAPLRERRLDIVPLAKHFAASFAMTFDWEPAFVEKLLVYRWPLNVRELRAMIQRVGLLHQASPQTAVTALLGEALRSAVAEAPAEPAHKAGTRINEAALREALMTYGGNIAKVAAHFGKQRKQIYLLVQRLGLPLDDFRKPGRSQ